MPGLADLPLLTAEFLAVDTETNGLAREALRADRGRRGARRRRRAARALGLAGRRRAAAVGRGIQRFTGISQAMVDAAPPPRARCCRSSPRSCAAACSSPTTRASTRACCARRSSAPALDWPDPPVLCTVALARRLAPLQRRRGLAALADALGIEVAAVHRALPDAETCARVFCALFPKLCAHAATVGEALALLRPQRAARAPRAQARASARATPAPRHLAAARRTPASTSSATPTGARSTSASRSACARARARTSRRRATWTGQAEHVDYQPTHSELGALVLENRLIKALQPPGNKQLKRTPDGYVYLRCRLDIPFPILEVAREPAAGHSVTSARCAGGPPRPSSSSSSTRCSACATAGAGCRARDHPSAYGQMGRCLSPCLRRPRPEPLPRAPRRGARAVRRRATTAAPRCSPTSSARCARRRPSSRYERAAWLRRRHARLRHAAARGSAACCARSHAGSRLVLAPHPTRRRRATTRSGSSAAASSTGAPLPEDPAELAARTADALRAAPAAGARRLAAAGRDRRGADRRPLAGGARGARARARAGAGPAARWRRWRQRRLPARAA